MKRLKLLVIGIAVFFSLSLLATSSTSAGWVNGYVKDDGTYVNGYWKSDPNGLKYDNYSFDGDWSDAFNDSYYSSDRDYSSDWYSPSWVTDDDYWLGKSFYDSRNGYSDYSSDLFDYDYDYWDDPIYNYTPSYNYGYDYLDYRDSYSSNYFDYDYDSYDYSTPSYNSYDSYDSYDYDAYDYDSYDSYDSCYSYYCY